jgi:serine/threonine-protein kinase
MTGLRRSGDSFPVEVALSTWSRRGQSCFTAIVRDLSRERANERCLESMFALVVDLLAGQVLEGRYLLERLLRSDPFGSLYEALDLEQRAPVMIRVVRALWPSGPHEVAPPSPHPHAVELLAAGVTERGLPYAVMEPLSGETIDDRLRRRRAVRPAEALSWSRAVAEALIDAHDHGEVHGRLCAASLFLENADTPAQKLSILNFELRTLAPPSAVLATGVGCELAPFCAPELRAGCPPTPASDLYAFAVVLGVLFAGERPPAASEPPLADWLAAVMPAQLSPVAVAAIDPDPQRRPDARAVAGAIARMDARFV